MSELSKDDALYEWTDPDGTPLKVTMLPSGNPELFGQRTPVAMQTPMWLCAPGYYAYRELVRLSRANQPDNTALVAELRQRSIQFSHSRPRLAALLTRAADALESK